MRVIKNFLRGTPLFDLYATYQDEKFQEFKYQQWVDKGKIIPSPTVVKQRIVREYAKRYHSSAFVETGTYQGDMINFVKGVFKKIYSIELSMELYQQARIRFARYKHINLLQGNSGDVLTQILSEIDEPCLFWLDGHYSEGVTAKGDLETPIKREINLIFRHSKVLNHIILIDDARLFVGKNDYPTLQEMKRCSETADLNSFQVKDDIIRIHRSRR